MTAILICDHCGLKATVTGSPEPFLGQVCKCNIGVFRLPSPIDRMLHERQEKSGMYSPTEHVLLDEIERLRRLTATPATRAAPEGEGPPTLYTNDQLREALVASADEAAALRAEIARLRAEREAGARDAQDAQWLTQNERLAYFGKTFRYCILDDSGTPMHCYDSLSDALEECRASADKIPGFVVSRPLRSSSTPSPASAGTDSEETCACDGVGMCNEHIYDMLEKHPQDEQDYNDHSPDE